MRVKTTVVCLPVTDLQRSLGFYRAFLERDDAKADGDTIVLELPNLSLFLMQRDGFEAYSRVPAAPRCCRAPTRRRQQLRGRDPRGRTALNGPRPAAATPDNWRSTRPGAVIGYATDPTDTCGNRLSAPGIAHGPRGCGRIDGATGVDALKLLGLFVATLAEIVGCYLPYLWLKLAPAWLPARAEPGRFVWLPRCTARRRARTRRTAGVHLRGAGVAVAGTRCVERHRLDRRGRVPARPGSSCWGRRPDPRKGRALQARAAPSTGGNMAARIRSLVACACRRRRAQHPLLRRPGPSRRAHGAAGRHRAGLGLARKRGGAADAGQASAPVDPSAQAVLFYLYVDDVRHRTPRWRLDTRPPDPASAAHAGRRVQARGSRRLCLCRRRRRRQQSLTAGHRRRPAAAAPAARRPRSNDANDTTQYDAALRAPRNANRWLEIDAGPKARPTRSGMAIRSGSWTTTRSSATA